MAFMKKNFIHYFLISAVILLPFAPLTTLAATKKADPQDALLQQIMQHTQGPSQQVLAQAVLGKLPSFDQKNSIIGSNERRELQIDDLAKKLDKAETSFGSVALSQSLQPIADLQKIMDRQSWAKTLLDDTKLFASIQRSLKRVKKSEHAMLAYWDASQRENSAKLFARAESFYYSILQKLFGKKVNDNKWALEGSMIWSMGTTAWNLLFYVGLQAVVTDFAAWITTGVGNVPSEDDDDDPNGTFNPLVAFKKGLYAPFKMFDPRIDDYGRAYLGQKKDGSRLDPGFVALKRNELEKLNKKDEGPRNEEIKKRGIVTGKIGDGEEKLYIKKEPGKTSQDWIRAVSNGTSFGTKFSALYYGQKSDSKFELGCIGRVTKKVADYCGLECMKKSENGEEYNKLDKDGTMHIQYRENAPQTNFSKALRGSMAGVGAAAVTYWQAVMLWEAAKSSYGQAKHIITTMNELHRHTIHLARVINTARAVAKQLENHKTLATSTMVEQMNKVIKNPSPEMEKLFDLLEKDTFSVDKAKSQLFSRGNVLLAHRLMSRVRDEIVPLLQGFGELDALMAMVKNVKGSTAQAPFSFAEFVPSAQAMIDVKDGWLPLVRNAVPNTIAFGGDKPNKIIITGPNGGGKSVFLKLLGIIAIMAQSWGIVPAQHVRMTIFDGLRSCVHPEESLEHELSTFMAEKIRVDEIKDFVFRHNNPKFKVMLLLDEPYRGTVDAESADRIYAFGQDIAPLQQSIVVVATHVEKPARLAQETNGAFANYHVQIEELQGGRFERKFTLEPGILEWWFKDAAKRSRFIDFVTMEKHKEQVTQMMADKKAAQ